MTKPAKGKRPAEESLLPRGARDPAWVRRLLIAFLFVHIGFVILLPFAHVLATAFSEGVAAYLRALADKDARAAIGLTLLTAALAVPLNTVMGVCLAWGLTRRPFLGRRFIMALIDLPLSISPVVAGLLFLLVFGKNGWLGDWLAAHGARVIFAAPGVVLATLFVTLPFVARELIPLMASGMKEAEEAARLLGAGRWRIFRKITLPEIKWGLLYGIVLCNARAMGEFGAVSVVSGAYPRQDGHAAAAHRGAVQRLRSGGGERGRLAAGAAGPGHAGGAGDHGMADRPEQAGGRGVGV